MSRKIDAAAHDEHAFAGEPSHLLAERTAPGRKCDPPVRAQHAMPWEPRIGHLAEDASDEPRAAGQARARGELAVTRDRAFRNRPDRLDDRGRIDRRAGLPALRLA